jgi:hypothetical protein
MHKLATLVTLVALASAVMPLAACNKKSGPRTYDELKAAQSEAMASFGKVSDKERYSALTKKLGEPHEVVKEQQRAIWYGVQTYNGQKSCKSLEVDHIDGAKPLSFYLGDADAPKCSLP